MSKNTTINLRVNSDIKESVGEILASMGLTFSEAVNMLFHQIHNLRALPFEVKAFQCNYRPSAETLALLDRIESGEEEMAGPFSTFEEFMASLEGDDDDEI